MARQAPLAELFEKAGIDPQAYSATVDLVNVNLDDQERAAVADGILVVRIYGTDLVDGNKIALAMKAAALELQVAIEWGGDWKSFKDGPHFQLTWEEYPA